jgi:alkanesulfonate monooxygenase SsuD/methylene tetrahydromethanopterin reductase-like flavin-dependent oxidoreductase (luciferase family)
MTSCVVADDRSDLVERLAAFKTVTGSEGPAISGTVDQVATRLREYEQVGVERVMLQHIAHEDVAMVGVLGAVAAQLG